MDGVTLALIAAGAGAGVVTGLVPGLHVNTLAAIGLALLPVAGLPGTLFLVSVGIVHTIVNILPATYLGVPDEDDVLLVLPAHRLLQDGRGPEAVQASVRASLAALMATVAALPFYGWLLLGPPDLLGRIDRALPFALGTAVVALLVSERHRGRGGIAWAALLLASSGGLGMLAFRLPLRSLAPVPPTPLLPLLGGLFGAAGLLSALRRPGPLPEQWDRRIVQPPATAVAGGTLAAAATAVIPGITGAVASTLVPRRPDDPLHAISVLSAVNTAHATFALAVLLLAGRTRSGLADAVSRWTDLHWTWPPAGAAADLVTTVLLAGALGTAATLALSHPTARHAHRLPGRGLAAAALLLLAATTVAVTGLLGLILLAAATALGLVPIAAGVRRVHLIGCLLIPLLVRSL